jgi:hypothetical protein
VSAAFEAWVHREDFTRSRREDHRDGEEVKRSRKVRTLVQSFALTIDSGNAKGNRRAASVADRSTSPRSSPATELTVA